MEMSDLIKRADAIKALKETEPTVWTESDYELGQKNQWSSDELAILIVPSAEPKKGRWVRKEKKLDLCTSWWFQCSECGKQLISPTLKDEFRYCPECGSKNEVTE